MSHDSRVTDSLVAPSDAAKARWAVGFLETVACRWCGCIGYHAETCKGFDVNDPAVPLSDADQETTHG
jgi:hypothetical protein